VVARCRSRNLLPFPSLQEIEDKIPIKTGNGDSNTSKNARELRRKGLAKVLNLSHLYVPRTYAFTYYKIGEKWHYAAFTSNGNILGANPIKSTPKGGEQTKFKSLDMSSDVTHYAKRVEKLSFLLNVISEHGICKDAYKPLKRLNLVAFTSHYNDFVKLVNLTARKCGYRWSKTRNPVPCAKHKGKHPSFTGETRSIDLLNGHHVRLWTWIPNYVREDHWSTDDIDS